MLWQVDAKAAKRLNDIAAAAKTAKKLDSRDRPGSRRRSDLLACPRSAQGQEGPEGHPGRACRVQRDHQDRRARRDETSAPDRCSAGRFLSRPPGARLSRRLQSLAGALAQIAGRALGGPRAIRRLAARLRPRTRNRAIRHAGILDASGASEDQGRCAVRRPNSSAPTGRRSAASISRRRTKPPASRPRSRTDNSRS